MKIFDFSNIKGDMFGGINAGIVALPAALAFGTIAGLDPINGLYGAIILGLLAAIFGGTPTLISNPTGPMALVTGITVGALIGKLSGQGIENADSMVTFMPYLVIIFVLAGLFQIIFGVVKLGKYVHYIPYPVVSGFMSGIGGIILVNQINKFLGSGIKPSGALDILLSLPESIGKADITSVALASVTILIIYLFPKVTKAVPSALVAIFVVTLGAFLLGVDASYLIGEIPRELPIPKIDALSNFGSVIFGADGTFNSEIVTFIIGSAFYLAMIGMIDALLTAVVADKLTKTKHNSDRELIGQGIGNLVSALFGGVPGAGTTPSTVLNIRSGARTRLSGIIHAVVLVLILAAFAPVAAMIPKAALAGVLITIGISILDVQAVRHFKKMPMRDNIVMLAVLILTIFWDLLPAVAIGLVMAALIFMKQMSDVVERDSKDSKVARLVDQLIANFADADAFREHVHVYNLRGPMFFGFASRFQDSIDLLPQLKAVIINFSAVPYMDQSGLYTLEEAIVRMKDRGFNVCLSELSDEDHELLSGIGVIPGLVDEKHVFSSVEECIMWLNEPGHLDNVFSGDDELYIPSAYTPNGDGINDEWQLRNIEKFPQAHIVIKTREGKVIFDEIGYTTMWEGIYDDKMLPSDTYHYEIDLYNDGSDVRKGNVSIFR